jgi:hypothetical protein
VRSDNLAFTLFKPAVRGYANQVEGEPITGIPGIDETLKYVDPVPKLLEHFRRRREEGGEEAVIAALEQAVRTVPEGSPAHAGLAGWPEQARRGEALE